LVLFFKKEHFLSSDSGIGMSRNSDPTAGDVEVLRIGPGQSND